MNKANVDLKTGRISNCEVGSWRWYHEEGHLRYQEKYSFLSMVMSDFIYFLWLFTLTVAFVVRSFWYLSVLCLGFIMLHTIFEESWCNLYANKRFINDS